MEKRVDVLAVTKTGAVATVRSSRVTRAGTWERAGRGDISSIVVIGDLGSEMGARDMKKPFSINPTFREVVSVSYSASHAVSYTF